MRGKNLISETFFAQIDPQLLLEEYGSPLYVYNEAILKKCCHDMLAVTSYPNFKVNYSVKANANLSLLTIIRDEGLKADAMSPGEIELLLAAGFAGQDIFFVANNVGADEFQFALDKGALVSVDSLDQLELFARTAPGSAVALRVNPGFGAGHHKKVITAGRKTKFGINEELLAQAKDIASQYDLRIVGLNQHIGSQYMEAGPFLTATQELFNMAGQFPDLTFLDLGGGFGIPYRKLDGEKPLNIAEINQKLTPLIDAFVRDYGRQIEIRIEPGRYICAESGILLGTAHAGKENGGVIYVGTDIGFNTFARPSLYDSWHDILVFRDGELLEEEQLVRQTIVGNICESGDIIADRRPLPEIQTGDLIAILDAGAYGYSMSSNYNGRLRPAEVLLQTDGSHRLIRRRETTRDLLRTFPD